MSWEDDYYAEFGTNPAEDDPADVANWYYWRYDAAGDGGGTATPPRTSPGGATISGADFRAIAEFQYQAETLRLRAQQGNQEAAHALARLEESKRQFDQELQYKYRGLDQQTGLGVLGLLAQLRGPKDAFTQQRVLHGINQQGLSNAVDAIAGRIRMPAFQAPQASPEPATLESLLAQAGAGGPGAAAATAGLADAIRQAREQLTALNPSYAQASDQEIIDKVKSDPTLFTGDSPIGRVIRAAPAGAGSTTTPIGGRGPAAARGRSPAPVPAVRTPASLGRAPTAEDIENAPMIYPPSRPSTGGFTDNGPYEEEYPGADAERHAAAAARAGGYNVPFAENELGHFVVSPDYIGGYAWVPTAPEEDAIAAWGAAPPGYTNRSSMPRDEYGAFMGGGAPWPPPGHPDQPLDVLDRWNVPDDPIEDEVPEDEPEDEPEAYSGHFYAGGPPRKVRIHPPEAVVPVGRPAPGLLRDLHKYAQRRPFRAGAT